MIWVRLGPQRAATRRHGHCASAGHQRPTVRTAIWVSMDMTGYGAAETVVMLARVPTTDLVGMK
jgi:hypothetical protein